MSTWNIRYGKWWMVQWCWDKWLSVGIHIDFKKRFNGIEKSYYGPYVDFHFGWIIISIGRNPVYSGHLHSLISISRGGKIVSVE